MIITKLFYKSKYIFKILKIIFWKYIYRVFLFFRRAIYNHYTFSYMFKKGLKMTLEFFFYCGFLVWAELWCLIIWGFLALPIVWRIQFLFYRTFDICGYTTLETIQYFITHFIWYFRVYNARMEVNRWHRIMRHVLGWILVYSYFYYF